MTVPVPQPELDVVHLALLHERPGDLPGLVDLVRRVEIEDAPAHDLPLPVASGHGQRSVAAEHHAGRGVDDGEHVGGEIVEAPEGTGAGL